MNESQDEINRIKNVRKYFEEGCLCIHEGTIDKKDVSTSDLDAIHHYESNCKCSRNYHPK